MQIFADALFCFNLYFFETRNFVACKVEGLSFDLFLMQKAERKAFFSLIIAKRNSLNFFSVFTVFSKPTFNTYLGLEIYWCVAIWLEAF